MRISIIGSGYVGLVTGAGLAETGHEILCMDIDENRIRRLNQGDSPLFEPGLDELLSSNLERGNLRFSSSLKDATERAEAIIIAVGTPASEDGSADLSHVLAVATNIGKYINQSVLVIVKSTVPVGTCDKVRACIEQQLKRRDKVVDFHIASNPEFLAEGSAVANFMNPDRIVCGVESEHSEELLRELYAPFNRNHEKLLFMDIRSSELTKYAANAMLATKISLMNELANIAENAGADIEKIRRGIGSDPRIGYSFIYAGPGYGGSCFPKDVRALSQTAQEFGLKANVLDAVEAVNNYQKTHLFQMLLKRFGGDLSGKNITIWGLAFKPNTNDMREAPSRILIEALLEAGAQVNTHDPEATQEGLDLYGSNCAYHAHSNQYQAASNADALVLVTEWKHYWIPDFDKLAGLMKQKNLFDGRNIWPQNSAVRKGFNYFAIGRPAIEHE